MILTKTQMPKNKFSSRLNLIAGKTLKQGVPISCTVRVYSRLNGALLATMQSNTIGEYKAYLPDDLAYSVISIDPNKQYNAVIQDNMVPK